MTIVRGAVAAVLLLAAAASAARPPARVIGADGAWAVLVRGRTCEAASAAMRPAAKDRPQARASLSFDAGRGARRGQFAARLSRMPRPGGSVMLTVGDAPFLLTARGDMAWSRGPAQEAAIIAAMRAASGMRVDARGPSGVRIVDRYDLSGAPTSIDAAAACAATMLVNR